MNKVVSLSRRRKEVKSANQPQRSKEKSKNTTACPVIYNRGGPVPDGSSLPIVRSSSAWTPHAHTIVQGFNVSRKSCKGMASPF